MLPDRDRARSLQALSPALRTAAAPGYLAPPARPIVVIACQECLRLQITRWKPRAPGAAVPQSP